MPSFSRRRLKHDTPAWVDDGAIYFITINCEIRGYNSLATDSCASAIRTAAHNYTVNQKWHPILVVIMPDHIHMLVSLNTAHYRIQQILGPWKSYLRKTAGINWQQGFFEHRIRNEDSLREKIRYLCLNPVRAGLVENGCDWKYTWDTDEILSDY
ncbi:REP-associated tyrosine transposase [Coraliomargarita akajimensis]|uniref:Transposase IS200-like domain-containing protein n=1 Tax=Coraliomargarita akajimensis (strain DSM 45221 / IAM 15411 / JCM 23193 / KCTC 12865 / 04OKA010-24) TaxID=583355 RepID=D5ER43_CORAD|nr:transposase [Coraliomargarita akajimensis]ADE55887.1 conserved hypothetical protein [Coraliomargarita akajimensis DSM 45221]